MASNDPKVHSLIEKLAAGEDIESELNLLIDVVTKELVRQCGK
jgi:hypothetical protein